MSLVKHYFSRFSKFKLIFFILAYFLFLFSGTAWAELSYQGLSAYEIQTLKQRLPDLNSKNPNLSSIDRAIKYLMSTGNYSTVSVYQEAPTSRLIVGIPLKKLSEIEIVGNKHFDADEITNILNLKIGTKFDSARIAGSVDDLKEYYGKNGYLNTIISIQVTDAGASNVKLQIQIKERDPCRIEKITFKTENKILIERLHRLLKRNVGQVFSEDNLINTEQSIEDYLKEHRYINSILKQLEAKYNAKKTQVELIYEITDPYFYELIFKNNTELSSGEILMSLKLEEFSKGSTDPSRDINIKIKDYYISEGYPMARADFQEKINDENYQKNIIFDINEGPRVIINNIDVLGRLSRSSDYYAKIIFKNSSENVESKLFVREGIDNGITNLITELNNEGYLRAKLQSVRVEYNAKKDKVDIVVLMDEGPLTQLSDITFYGNKSFTSAQLIKQLEIINQAPLQLNKLEASVNKLKQYYKQRGFLEMVIENEGEELIQYENEGLKAHVVFKLVEGPQIFVRRVVVDGNTFTKDYVILREVNIDPGDLLTPNLLDEGKKRLDKLGIFSRVELRTLEANTNVSQRTLVVSVSERNPGLFRLGAGITNKRDLTARGFAGVSYININGTARGVSLRGTVESGLIDENYFEYETTFGYLEPFLFESKYRGRINYSRSEKVVDDLTVDTGSSSEDVLQIRATDTLTFSMERDITSNVKFTWLLWGKDRTEQFLVPNPQNTPDTQLDIAYIGPSIDIDFRDNPFLPTKGTYTKLDVEYSSPFIGSSKKVEFIRSQATFTHYQQVTSPKWVWANSIRGGYEKNLSTEDGSGVPISFAFFLGDYTTIRGYSGTSDDRIPNSTEFPVGDTDQLIIPKESTYYLLKSELRFPLGSGPFGGVLFYDGGEVAIQGYEFKNPFRQSVGLGVRVNTPVGPISLDYGRKIDRQPDESPDHWHLSIGTF